MMSTVQHATLTLERRYPVPRSRVFVAWTDLQAKARWFDESEAEVVDALAGDVREGGREAASVRFDGKLYTYEAVYRDIRADERIVSTFEMGVDGRRMSVSIATVELSDIDDGTWLVFTEQGVYFDDLDRPEWREQGTAGQLDRLGDELAHAATPLR